VKEGRFYVGVDQSLRKIGVCVLEGETPVLLRRLTPASDLRGPERLVVLRDLLSNVLTPWRGRIIAAAMEAQSLGSIGDIDQLGQINGVVQVILTDLGAKPYLVPPAVLKKFVTGRSGADKNEMMRTSALRWNFDFTQHGDDVCDAHGLARIALECTEQNSTRRHEIEAAATVLRGRTRRRRTPLKFFSPTI
jgi:Holliday junction resolvasome RuvABC endonuclease subunit